MRKRLLTLLMLAASLTLMSIWTGTARAQQDITPVPTPSPGPTGTPDPESTEEPIPLVFEPAEDQIVEPPISIDLPEDWRTGIDTLLIRDLIGLQLIPFAIYTGPVSGGQGYIVLLWGFDTIGRVDNPATGEGPHYGPYLDALRLLRLAVIGTDCTTGTDSEREFSVGGISVTGANFSAYRCEETEDTRGWFLGIQQDGLNFAFYTYTEPIDAMDGDAPFELQAILDSVEFEVEEFRASLPTLTPTVTPTATATPAEE